MIIKNNGWGWDIYPFEETSGVFVRVCPNDGFMWRVQLKEALPAGFGHPDWWREVIAALEKGRELANEMNAVYKQQDARTAPEK